VRPGVAGSQLCAVSPKRGAAHATLEALAQAFTAPRKPKNVALTAWPSGEADPGAGAPPPRYLVGELTSAEAGPAELRLRLRMSAAQEEVDEPLVPASNTSPPAGGYQAASCSLFLDPGELHWFERCQVHPGSSGCCGHLPVGANGCCKDPEAKPPAGYPAWLGEKPC
jgi:hypothetical protein